MNIIGIKNRLQEQSCIISVDNGKTNVNGQEPLTGRNCFKFNEWNFKIRETAIEVRNLHNDSETPIIHYLEHYPLFIQSAVVYYTQVKLTPY